MAAERRKRAPEAMYRGVYEVVKAAIAVVSIRPARAPELVSRANAPRKAPLPFPSEPSPRMAVHPAA